MNGSIKISELDQKLNSNELKLLSRGSEYGLIKSIQTGQIQPLIGMGTNCKDIEMAIELLYKNIKFEETNRYIYFGQPTTEQLLDDFKNGDMIYAVFDYSSDTLSCILYDELFDRVLPRYGLDDSFITLAMAIIYGAGKLHPDVMHAMKLAARNCSMSDSEASFAAQVFNNTALYLDTNLIKCKDAIETFFLEENGLVIENIAIKLTLDDINGYYDISKHPFELNCDILVQYSESDKKAKLYAITPYGYKSILRKYFDVVHQNGLEFILRIDEIESVEDLIKVLNGTYNEFDRNPFDEDEFEDICDYCIKQYGLVEKNKN